MSRGQAYPPDLARYVEENWPEGSELGVSGATFTEVLAVAYQASMTTEEARPTRFRLLVAPLSSLPESGVPNHGVLRLLFEPSRPFTAQELRRLSPATPFESSLIGAHVDQDKLRIWGVAHSGPAWLAPTWGGRSRVPNWTYAPIVHVTGPGQLAVRCAGKLIAAIERGEIVDAQLDVFESQWLSELFSRERDQVQAEHAQRQLQAESPTQVESALVARVTQQMVRRAIQLVRGAHHGGLILVVDQGKPNLTRADAAATARPPTGELRGLRLKYRFAQDEPSHRYRSLLSKILVDLAAASTKAEVGWGDFEADSSSSVEHIERAIFELSRLIANLSAIDGAVVLDKRFGILGFGAEVSAELPSPSQVWRALDPEAHYGEPEDIENVGTRHRAAYRFAQDNPDGFAVVISHDGGVSFVVNRGGRVVFWEQSVSP
jgi:hypothetical protein